MDKDPVLSMPGKEKLRMVWYMVFADSLGAWETSKIATKTAIVAPSVIGRKWRSAIQMILQWFLGFWGVGSEIEELVTVCFFPQFSISEKKTSLLALYRMYRNTKRCSRSKPLLTMTNSSYFYIGWSLKATSVLADAKKIKRFFSYTIAHAFVKMVFYDMQEYQHLSQLSK